MSMVPSLEPISTVILPTEEPGTAGAARGPWALVWRRLRRDKASLISVAFICLLVTFALAAPAFESWTGHPKNTSNPTGTDDVNNPLV